jgi:two-component system, NarL family, nitrate/nitrite sensor histidine kinase NarX
MLSFTLCVRYITAALDDLHQNKGMNPLVSGRAGTQGRLGIVLVGFLALMLVSVGLTFAGLQTERQDGRVINLAGRQRMLAQQMARLALQYEQEGEDHYRAELSQAADAFAQTFSALREGGTLTDYTGQTVVFSTPEDAEVLASLEALAPTWQTFQAHLTTLLRTRTGAQDIESQAPVLVERADQVVQSYEAAARAKIDRLHRLQIGFLVAGFLLVAAGWWILHISVVRPIQRLEESARRIGAGDLETPVTVSGPTEVQALGSELEATRHQLKSSRQELQAGVEILEQRVQQRTAELAALATVSREISSHLDLGTVLKSVTAKAQQLLGGEVAELCVLDSQQACLHLHATAGPEEALRQATSTVAETSAGMVLSGKTARSCAAQTCPGFCEILVPAYRAAHLATPVRLGDRVIGALCVGSSQAHAFSADAPGLLTQLAEVAAVAIENSRLYQEVERGATLIERQRIASEMHDGLLQTLSFLHWTVHLTEERINQGDLTQVGVMLQKIERADLQAETEIRRAISSLHEDFPVQVTLQEQLAAAVAESAGAVPVPQFESHVKVPIVLPRQDAEQVLRVVREAVSNAQRHSRAQNIQVAFERAGSELSVAVADDGLGFDPQMLPSDGRAHFGLKIMRARAARLGGELRIDSTPKQGTRIIMRWCLQEQRP